jgi:L-fucose isomerase-like protein
MTYLNLHGLEGEILHGSSGYIASRIKALLSGDRAYMMSPHREERLEKAALGGRYGVVGRPSDWLIASVPDYSEVGKRLGTELVDIPMQELLAAYEAEKQVADIRDGLDFGSSERLVKAVHQIRDRHSLDGLTIRCFDLLDSIHTTGCLSLAHLNQEGSIGCCEGDIMSMLTMAVVRKVTGQSSFQANPSRIDTESNTMVLAHCTLPLDMVDSLRYDTHFESGIGVAVKGELHEQPVTVLRISSDFRFWCTEGRILRNMEEKTLCRTQIEVQLDEGYSVGDLLGFPCGNHHMVFYGRHRKDITAFLCGA